MTTSTNKIVLITGGARRIGEATARHLHQQGMHIVIHHNKSAQEAQALQQDLCSIRENSASLVQGDLRDISTLTHNIRQVVEELGQLDGIINNASVFYPTPLDTSKEQDWDMIFNANLKAPYFLAQAVAPYLKKSHGAMVNIVDIYAQRPLLNHAIYCASKAGLVSLTQSLARELGPEVRVNAIAPGAILWPENETDEAAQQQMIAQAPLNRMGNPEDIAKTIHFLIEGSQFITGQVINVDGGRTVTP